MPLWHKSTKTTFDNNTSEGIVRQSKNYTETECPECIKLNLKNQELEAAIQHLSGAVKANSFKSNIIRYQVPKTKFKQLLEVISNSFELTYLEFDDIGNFVSAISDTDRSLSISMSE